MLGSTVGSFSIEPDQRQFPGSLTFGKRPSLRLVIVSPPERGKLPPPFDELEKGKQTTIIGNTSDLNCVTLLGCSLQNNVHRTSLRGRDTLELTLHPMEIWTGPNAYDDQLPFDGVGVDLKGIHSVVGYEVLARTFVTDEAEKEQLAKLGITGFEIFHQDEKTTPVRVSACIGEDDAEISFETTYSSSYSHIWGINIKSKERCFVRFKAPHSGASHASAVHEVENFLSFICLKTIRSRSFTLQKDDAQDSPPITYRRLWYLGIKRGAKEALFHQTLSTFRYDREQMSSALANWFRATKEEGLARWLFLDALDQRTLSSPRFIAICQAAEILGRAAARKALRKKRTFAEYLRAFLDGIPPELRSAFLRDDTAFISDVIKMRNLFVHMGENDRFSLTEAHRLLPRETYRLLALIACHEASRLELSPNRVLSGLRQSSLGRAALYRLRKEAQI